MTTISCRWSLPIALGCLSSLTQPTNAAWIDAATGQPVYTVPYTGQTAASGTGSPSAIGSDPNHASFPSNSPSPLAGHNLFWDSACHTWRDSATGGEVKTVPYTGQTAASGTGSPSAIGSDPNHASFPSNSPSPLAGHNLFWQSCPPPSQTAASSGLYIGGELTKNWGWVRSTERLAATDAITNQFSDRADPLGGGIIVGYKFAPWANNIIASPFASFDFIKAPVNHTFANGSYLGSTANFMATLGVKVGPQFDAFWIYGIAGVSALNETLNINFIPLSSSQSTWVAGGTVGIGGAWQPAILQGFGRPVSLFLEYQHTWWQTANYNTPAASPAFNYNFARQDDMLKFGFIVALSPAPAASRPLVTK